MVGEVLSSEFFWGVVIGVALSIAGAYAGTRFGIRAQNAELRRRQLNFAIEIISETKKLIVELDTHRSRARVIHPDFLNMLEVEIAVYGRNRESFILLEASSRRLLLNYMREVAMKHAEIRQHLRVFDDCHRVEAECRAGGDTSSATSASQSAADALRAAHEKTDKLVAIGNSAPQL